ncbi:MAG: hypothetical protein Q4E74_07290, partial [Ruminococcus sp.]|nr:hypothetical protein [Ruminococcus sp.]
YYIEHNNFLKVSFSVIVISTIVGTVCWFLFFRGLFFLAIPLYFCVTMWGIHLCYALSEERREKCGDEHIYGYPTVKLMLFIVMLLGTAYLSAVVMIGVNLLFGGDFP